MLKKDMEDQLRTFLQEVRVRKGEPFTHVTKRNTSGGWSSGSYYIGGNDLDKFWIMYCNIVRKGVFPTIAERPSKNAPLRVDFDFKADVEHGLKRQYSKKTLKKIIAIYQSEIKKIILPSEFEEKQLSCIVLEKSAPRVEEGKVKDGFHLHFPFFICEGWVQDNYLRDKVTKRMIEEKVWGKVKFLTDLDDVIDKKMASKPWMLYGSMNYKNKNSTPYFYKRGKSRGDPASIKGFSKEWGRVYNSETTEITFEELFEDEMIGRKNSVKYYLPRFLSVRGYNEPTPLGDGMEKKRNAFGGRKRKKKRIKRTRTMEEVIADLRTIKEGEIMEMISDDRAENFDEWMDLGWTLFNIGQGCDEALEMWDTFSRRSSKYISGECEERWQSMEMRDKTIASLLAIARSDNPDHYKEWKDTNVRYQLWNSLREPKPNEYDVSKVVMTMYGDKFKCVDAKKNQWFRFDNHRWQEMDDGLSLRILLAEDVVQEYWNLNAEIAKRQTNGGDDDRNKLSIQAERCKAIITKLKECQFQDKLIKMCKLHMYDKNFMKKRDENHNLIGCENGVIDLELGIFRDGRPDDDITFSTNVDFVRFSEDDEEVQEFDEFILKVFPNKNRREYFLDFVTSCMRGGNVHKRFLIATGMGDNGKSVTFKIIELAFGDYFGKFPRELIVQSRGNNSSGARPELAQVRGKRIMGCQEVAKTEKMNIGVIKELTGNDSIYTRQLYEKGTTINPQFTLMMQCNELPGIPGHDEATWKRVRILDCESHFIKPTDEKKYPVPESREEQFRKKTFHADESLKERFDDFAQVLLWRCFDRYPDYKKRGLKEPKEVMVSTDIYKAGNDIYLQFIKEKIERVEDEDEVEGAFIRLTDMYTEFKDWYIINHPSYSKDKIGKATMKNELNKRLGVIRNDTDQHGFGKMSRWWGYRMYQDEEEVEDFQKLLGKDE